MNENEENKLNNNVQPNEPFENMQNTNMQPNESFENAQNINMQPNEPMANENINVNEKVEEPKSEEKSNLFWIIYIVVAIVIFIVILLLLRGCNGLKNQDKNKINETNEWVTNMWNKCVDPIYWYTTQGTGIEGADINIDTVLSDCDKYYNEYQTKKSEITNLSDEYSDFKNTYSKISEQIEIIYPKIKANKPVSEENVDYEENMDTFYKYQVELYNLIKEKYS